MISTLSWGVFLRLLGGMYVFQFLALDREILALAGARGISPIGPQLERIRRDFPGWRRLVYFPTLLWLGSSDRALRATCWLGALSGVALLVGGPLTRPALVACYLAYLSLDLAADLLYPWDCLLFEAGLLALALPELRLLPSLSLVAAPHPAIAWAHQWLLFRCVFGFGKYKFLGPGRAKRDWAYLHGFLASQPLPTPIGFWAGTLPLPLLKGALAGLFVVEMIAPFFLFVPGPPRVVAALLIFGLMVAIQLCGNFGHFNLIVAILCVPMLDHQTSILAATSGDLFGTPASALRSGLAALLLLLGLAHLPFNSWIARAWPFWPALEGIGRGALRPLLWLVRACVPFRIAHAYGVFGPESGPPVKWVPIIEGTRDGRTWRAYPYRYMASDRRARPTFIAPFCPRIDHFTIYDAYGIRNSAHFATLFSLGHPYRFSRAGTIDRILARLLDGSPEVLARFREDPFAGEGPPIAVRARLFMLLPATREHLAATGEWWLFRPVAPHTPPLSRAGEVFDDWLREAARFHPDDVVWARRAGEPAPPSADELALLWERFVPFLATIDTPPARPTQPATRLRGCPSAGSSQPVDVSAISFRSLFSRAERDSLERTLARVTRAASDRLPPTMRSSSFHDHLALLAGIADGERAFSSLCGDAPRLRRQACDPAHLRRGLLVLGLFWPEQLAYHARKARLRQVMLRGAAEQVPAVVPGFLRLLPLLAEELPATVEERLPEFARTAAGSYCLVGPAERGARIATLESSSHRAAAEATVQADARLV